jgi:hypothetical protein
MAGMAIRLGEAADHTGKGTQCERIVNDYGFKHLSGRFINLAPSYPFLSPLDSLSLLEPVLSPNHLDDMS